MSITARFQINQDRVLIEIPEKNISENKPNVVFFDSQAKQILRIGVSEEVVRDDFHKQGKDFSDNFRFGISFQLDDEISGFFDSAVVEYYLAVMYYEKQTFLTYLSTKIMETVDYDFQIVGYEKWSEQRRLKFEYELQSKSSARQLKINDINYEVPIWKRRIEKLTQFILTGIYFPAAILYFLSFFLFGQQNPITDFIFEKYPEFGIAIVITLFLGTSVIVGPVVWFFIARKILPKTYSSFVFEDLPSKSLVQKIAKTILSFQTHE